MVVTLLSDFGDVYPASMKGVILSINPSVNMVDISHSVPRHDVRAGAFMLMTCARYFPSCTVHIAVVDPGVGTERRGIAIRAGSADGSEQCFIGPDNGLLIPAARSIGESEVYEITNKNLFLPCISSTFHGRDVFAPVGAHISKGLQIGNVGRRIFDFVDLDFGEGEKKDGCLSGKIIFIDQFGNIVTNIHSKVVEFKPGDVLEIQKKRVLFHKSYGFCRKGEPLALIGSHSYLEIAVNQGNAAVFFNKKAGEEITVRKIT
ncbi:MAG: S-adenosyl-l-methionine hydroxide adenosyltransferase family protein [Candidatus Methanoperedens sp.]|nr:S-adenosyl-l-methionine hydroxide adenosyltransferase family protein [Candidatus Methanoperedens sp.]